MSFLLDSHVVVWLALDPSRLRKSTIERLLAADRLTISVISFWELGIKAHAGKLPLFPALKLAIEQWDATVLAVSRVHAEIAAALPLHHRDPFDRMLVAQAVAEDLTFVTGDEQLAQYSVRLLRA